MGKSIQALFDVRRNAGVLRRYASPYRAQLVVLTVALLCSTGLAVLSPQLLGIFIDWTRAGASLGRLAQIAGAFLGVTVLAGLLFIGSEYLGARVAWHATNAMRSDLAAHCLSLDLSFYEDHPAGEMIDRIDGDIGRLSAYFSDLFIITVSNVLLLFGIGVALLVQDWVLGACYVPFIAIAFAALRRLVGIALPAATAQRRAHAELLGYLEQRLAGLEDIEPNGAAGQVPYGFWLKAAGLMTASRRAARLSVRWPATAQALASVSMVLALGVGSLLYVHHSIPLGSVYVLVSYAGMLQAPLMMIVMQFRQLEESIGALRRINDLFAEQSTLADGPDAFTRKSPGTGITIELSEVSFCYQPGVYALRDISLQVAAGEVLALVGRTGSGKSTLARLLFRFADPTAGRVLLDGQDLTSLTLDTLRAQVAFVPQEVQVFHGTVAQNVSVFDDTVPPERIRQALADVGLGNWLGSLSEGVDTTLGVGAAGMSAGESQLLALARVLVADPGLVILDEASSRLDPASRRLLDTAMRRVFQGRTAVIIAHQLDALTLATKALVLSDGQAVESGGRDELEADPGSRFAAIMQTGDVPA